MADATITVQGVILKDNWPGATPIRPPVDYSDMTAASVGHNLVAPLWDLGTKWEVYCKGDSTYGGVGYNLGWSRFIYLKAAADMATAVAGAVSVLVVPDGTLAAGMAGDGFYTVVGSSARTTHEEMSVVAMCISTPTNSYYGWYWCGGVCPVEYVPGLTTASTLVTDDSLVASCELSTVASTATGIALRAQPADAQAAGCGFALYADTSAA